MLLYSNLRDSKEKPTSTKKAIYISDGKKYIEVKETHQNVSYCYNINFRLYEQIDLIFDPFGPNLFFAWNVFEVKL